MSNIQFAIEIVQDCKSLTLSQYEEIKALFLSMWVHDENLSRFLQIVFRIVEAERPKLLEMK